LRLIKKRKTPRRAALNSTERRGVSLSFSEKSFRG
jgi:hypothetical protein